MILLGVFIALHLNSFANAPPASSHLKIAFSKQWLNLLHTEKTFWGSYKSRQDGSDFFLAPNGKNDPLAELNANIDAFQNPKLRVGRFKLHPQCAFPARYHFLKTQTHFTAQDQNCPEFKAWIQSLDIKKISVVFSSAYANNPASLFGHTFLKFHLGSEKDTHSDLLNYGASFTADADTSGLGIKYIIYGLLGGFDGFFSMTPYYMKINEYNNADNRDLWEYELQLTPTEIKKIIEHYWELYNTAKFDYYFLDENCSYYILALLNVGNENWDLLRLLKFYTLPADSIRILTRIPGLVKKITFRPSLRKKFKTKLNQLSEKQRNNFESILKDSKKIQSTRDAQTLDSVIAFLNYEKLKAQTDSFPNQNLLHTALIHRSQLNSPTPTPNDTVMDTISNQPEKGHRSSQLGSGFVLEKENSFFELSHRFSLHDLLSSDVGYEPYSHLEFLHFKFRVPIQRFKLLIQQIELIDIISLSPWDFVKKDISWKIRASIDTLAIDPCKNCHALNLDGGAGITAEVINSHWIVYGLSGLKMLYGASLSKKHELGPFLQIGTLIAPSQKLKTHFYGQTFYDIHQSNDTFMQHHLEISESIELKKNLELRLQGLLYISGKKNVHFANENLATINYYY